METRSRCIFFSFYFGPSWDGTTCLNIRCLQFTGAGAFPWVLDRSPVLNPSPSGFCGDRRPLSLSSAPHSYEANQVSAGAGIELLILSKMSRASEEPLLLVCVQPVLAFLILLFISVADLQELLLVSGGSGSNNLASFLLLLLRLACDVNSAREQICQQKNITWLTLFFFK